MARNVFLCKNCNHEFNNLWENMKYDEETGIHHCVCPVCGCKQIDEKNKGKYNLIKFGTEEINAIFDNLKKENKQIHIFAYSGDDNKLTHIFYFVRVSEEDKFVRIIEDPPEDFDPEIYLLKLREEDRLIVVK